MPNIIVPIEHTDNPQNVNQIINKNTKLCTKWYDNLNTEGNKYLQLVRLMSINYSNKKPKHKQTEQKTQKHIQNRRSNTPQKYNKRNKNTQTKNM